MSDERRRFENLWNEHHDAVMAYTRRRAAPAHADDVVDETFLVAWRRIADVPGDALPWLYGVARRVIANHRRSLRRGKALQSKLSALPVEVAADPFDRAGGVGVLPALAGLSAKDREALLLVAWEGLEPSRAAEAAGCTAATFSVRLHRARKRLAAAMQESGAAGHKPGDEPATTLVIEDAP
jgi:RNA polymerase sigma-70 factor, ECF subfamily